MINKPKALKKGDTIAIIAPSSPVKNHRYINLLNDVLECYGLNPIMYPSCYAKHGFLAGNDSLRAKDINDAFADKYVNGILCIKGGYGTPRLLPLLDYETIRRNPKVFMGYSDITGLHMVLNQICRMVTFHGPVGMSDCFVKNKMDEYTKKSIINNIFKTDVIGSVKNPIGEEIITINDGQTYGEIIGGNLSLLVSTLGSPYEIDTRGKILFIEDVGEMYYRLDRMFNSLALAGKFKDCNGIILGTWNKCEKEYEDFSLSLETIIDEIIKPYNKPTINNFRAGHIHPQATIAFGTKVRLNATTKEIEFLESACI
ncbi:LD-carboxypeptidase [Clostridiaceae bacterium M8S5]|nr:LD-carboxypeptidase [Clostridiaceae bacterium M8S5]